MVEMCLGTPDIFQEIGNNFQDTRRWADGHITMAKTADHWSGQRRKMTAQIEKFVRDVAGLPGGALDPRVLDPRVLAAMETVQRHEFVPAEYRAAAYKNRPLPIGHGQTISQPFIVAVMTDLLGLQPDAKVLEIGTGCGYQAAVLSLLARQVFTIEIIAALGERAAKTLHRLGYVNVDTRIGDGYAGWESEAPFDAVIATAAPDHVPPALVAQLKPGGRLVIPVGDVSQNLMVIEKAAGGAVYRSIIPVRFVPMVRTP